MENEVVSYLRCACPGCEKPLSGQRTKYCSQKCQEKMSSILRSKECKGVYKSLDGWAGGPRGLISESSIKKNESFVGGQDRFVVDDYPVDPDIFAIAEANHEKYILDRNEYEARVVIDGLDIFVKEYNKNHKKSYANVQSIKNEAKLTEDQRVGRNARSREYYAKNKELLARRQKEKYAANKERYREYSRKYYENKKEIIAEARKIRSERS
tara:strand:+ start:22 stop:654 length:633 start_codon:yes stop_codon:yes gene_type:complete